MKKIKKKIKQHIFLFTTIMLFLLFGCTYFLMGILF